MEIGETMRRILIIEDDISLRDNLSEILAMEGYNPSNGYDVISTDNGSSGINFSLCLNPELIICDINMPGFDGYTVLSQLRRFGRQTPFIFLTAKSDPRDIERGIGLGANLYVTKPYVLEEFISMVKRVLTDIPSPSSASKV